MNKKTNTVPAELSIIGVDLADKIVLVREGYADPLRLFHAQGGFGCNPEAAGQAVFGRWIADGKKSEGERINRADILRLASPDEIQFSEEYLLLPASDRWVRQLETYDKQVSDLQEKLGSKKTLTKEVMKDAIGVLWRHLGRYQAVVHRNIKYIAEKETEVTK